jgi:hypothetical protein
MLYLHEIGASGHPMAEAATGQLFVSEARVRLLADPYDTFGRQSGTQGFYPSVSLFQGLTFILVLVRLFPEGQTHEAWEYKKKQY